MRMYVGNLNYRTDEEALRNLFSEHGEVEDAVVITDRETGQSRGFGFVTMTDDQEAQAAIEALDGNEFDGRQLRVNEARPKGDR